MNRGITKENLLFILPPALTHDKSIVALATGCAEALEERLAEIDRARIISNIEGLDEAVLGILARDFKVDWWDPQYSIEEKRRTLKDSWRVHKILGTKAAVETAIRAIYPGTKVREWFEYGGKPFYFRLSIDGEKVQPDSEKHKKVLERVNYYKSLRSHLDGFIWNFSGEPFVNDPDDFALRRFIQSAVFDDRRSFPGILLDGSVPLDGSWLLDAVQRSMFGFSHFVVSGATAGVRGKLDGVGMRYGAALVSKAGQMELQEFRTRAQTAGKRTVFSFPCLKLCATMAKNRQSLSRSALTVDNIWRLDGSVPLDGSRILNAEIRQEDL